MAMPSWTCAVWEGFFIVHTQARDPQCYFGNENEHSFANLHQVTPQWKGGKGGKEKGRNRFQAEKTLGQRDQGFICILITKEES